MNSVRLEEGSWKKQELRVENKKSSLFYKLYSEITGRFFLIYHQWVYFVLSVACFQWNALTFLVLVQVITG
ncbi:hypothetical protein [Chryseobacterium sp. c4a]|uniref:hypothetical protein n=1 Tax=Chryseobacterium sp. c4a TaxID=1573582 RepID=UPI00135A1B2D|nr:hypothetical protein [Chryseobacterium sp. c4a]